MTERYTEEIDTPFFDNPSTTLNNYHHEEIMDKLCNLINPDNLRLVETTTSGVTYSYSRDYSRYSHLEVYSFYHFNLELKIHYKNFKPFSITRSGANYSVRNLDVSIRERVDERSPTRSLNMTSYFDEGLRLHLYERSNQDYFNSNDLADYITFNGFSKSIR